MNIRLFFYFLALRFRGELKKHIDTILLSTLLLTLLSGVMMTSSTYQHYINTQLEKKSDFVLQNRVGGKAVKMPEEWVDSVVEIRGVSRVTPRIYQKERDFLILGVDFLEDVADKNIDKLLKSIDLKRLLSQNLALVGSKFSTKSGSISISIRGKRVNLKTLPLSKEKQSLLPQNMILLPIDYAREVLNFREGYISDISFVVENGDEWTNILSKLDSLFFTSWGVDKLEIRGAYSRMFGFKDGFFLLIFSIVLLIFSLILYSRYSQLYQSSRRDIGILKAVGWSINSILLLIFSESLIIILISFILGLLGGVLLFYFGEYPFFGDIFLPVEELRAVARPNLYLDFATLSSIFILFALPFIASVIVPVWRIAITNPKESML